MHLRGKQNSESAVILPVALALAIACLPADLHGPIRVTEELWTPGESPPNPAQPRAPPTV